MKKKRKLKRVHLIYYLLVFDYDNGKLIGHIVDITTSGVKLMSRIQIENDTIYHFKMVLPEGLQEASKEITFKAKSIWSKDKMYSDFYGSGFVFESIAKDDIAILKKLIDQFGYIE